MPIKSYEQAMLDAGAVMDKPSAIKTGVKSGDIQRREGQSDKEAELVLVEPLKKHPEIPGLYRAIDPDTGWKGWVPYEEPPEVIKPPTEKELQQRKLEELRSKYRNKKEFVDEGIFTEDELGLPALKNEIKSLYQLLNP